MIPSPPGIALALFVGISILAIGIMARTVMRPAVGQAIRLNEDQTERYNQTIMLQQQK